MWGGGGVRGLYQASEATTGAVTDIYIYRVYQKKGNRTLMCSRAFNI